MAPEKSPENSVSNIHNLSIHIEWRNVWNKWIFCVIYFKSNVKLNNAPLFEILKKLFIIITKMPYLLMNDLNLYKDLHIVFLLTRSSPRHPDPGDGYASVGARHPNMGDALLIQVNTTFRWIFKTNLMKSVLKYKYRIYNIKILKIYILYYSFY